MTFHDTTLAGQTNRRPDEPGPNQVGSEGISFLKRVRQSVKSDGTGATQRRGLTSPTYGPR